MTPETRHNAHKVTYLIGQYPDHNIGQIIALLQLPAININCAIWAAIDEGLISDPDEQGGVTVLKSPSTWDFGPQLQNLETMLLYAFHKLNATKQDFEEHYLSDWTAGYSAHDVLIALRRLEDSRLIARYTIEDGENAYTFFTLYSNRKKTWGRKQFKKDPLENENDPT